MSFSFTLVAACDDESHRTFRKFVTDAGLITCPRTNQNRTLYSLRQGSIRTCSRARGTSYHGMNLRISMTLESYDEQHVWRRKGFRCGLDRDPLCGTNRTYADAAIAHGAFSPKQPFKPIKCAGSQTDYSLHCAFKFRQKKIGFCPRVSRDQRSSRYAKVRFTSAAFN